MLVEPPGAVHQTLTEGRAVPRARRPPHVRFQLGTIAQEAGTRVSRSRGRAPMKTSWAANVLANVVCSGLRRDFDLVSGIMSNESQNSILFRHAFF